jgi:hypothetical protein
MRLLAVAVVAIAAVAGGGDAGAATCQTPYGPPTCPKAAALAVFATNLSADGTVSVAVSGELLNPSDACTGPGNLTQPEIPLTCAGSGPAPLLCGRLTNLRPGAWAFRVRVQVSSSAVQEQAQQLVLVGGDAPNVSNVVAWTIYPATYVVATADRMAIVDALDAAAAYTATHPGPALVTFSRTTFPPGAGDAHAIDLFPGGCAPNTCVQPDEDAGLCLMGDRIVVDALDANGAPGAVVLSVGTCRSRLLRLYGHDDVLRGLAFRGSQFSYADPVPPDCLQADTVDVVGAAALRNRIERCVVDGPTCGDAVAVEQDAGRPDANGSADIAIVDSTLRGAEDRGLKVSTRAYATLATTCVADNGGGGVQATQGGHVTAVHNLVQRNLGTKNGVTARGNGTESTTLATDGNVVRLNGGRGVTVTDAAIATFTNDVVSDNETAGSRVETSEPGPGPQATFSGVAFVCNQLQVPGRAAPDGFGAVSGYDADPASTCSSCASGTCADPGCQTPDVSYGRGPAPGHNAFTHNAATPAGANFHDAAPGSTVTAVGNQWDHEPDPIAAGDVITAAGATVTVAPVETAQGGDPTLRDPSPRRPRRDELVRVYGTHFDAIDGAACANAGSLPTLADGCDPQNCPVATVNGSMFGNRVRLRLGGTTYHPEVYAVSPTMLTFRMPVDCVAGATLWINTGPADDVDGPKIDFCDPSGCLGQPAGTPCDDGDPCTTGDHCGGPDDPRCVPGASCGECATCDATQGCLPRTGACTDDANPCTTDVCQDGACTHPAGHAGAVCRRSAGTCDAVETCDGTHVDCPPDAKRTDECRTATAACDAGERCDGVADDCPPDAVAALGTVCRPAADGCDAVERCDGTAKTCPADVEVAGYDAVTCRTDVLYDALLRCGGRTARLMALLASAERAMATAATAPPCRAVRWLRTGEQRLRHLLRLLAPGRCATDVAPAPVDLAQAALDHAVALRRALTCRR